MVADEHVGTSGPQITLDIPSRGFDEGGSSSVGSLSHHFIPDRDSEKVGVGKNGIESGEVLVEQSGIPRRVRAIDGSIERQSKISDNVKTSIVERVEASGVVAVLCVWFRFVLWSWGSWGKEN